MSEAPLAPVAALLRGASAAREIAELLTREGEAAVSCVDGARPALLAALAPGLSSSGPSAAGGPPGSGLWGAALVVLPTPRAAEDFARDLTLFLGPGAVELFVDFEEFAWDMGSPDPAAAGARARASWRLASCGASTADTPTAAATSAATTASTPTPCIIVASIRSLMRRTAAPAAGIFEPLRLAPGIVLPPDEAARRLVAMGYERLPRVEEPGQFAVRGGILDVYPGTEPGPVRAEYLGDEIESLRRFVSSSQQSIGPLEEITLFASLDLVRDPETGELDLAGEVATLRSALPPDGLTVLVEPRALFDEAARFFDELRAGAPVGWAKGGKVKGYVAPADLDLASGPRLTFFTLSDADLVGALAVPSEPAEPMAGRIERLVARLRAESKAGRTAMLALRDTGQVRRLAEVLTDEAIPVVGPSEGPRPGVTWLIDADLTRGFSLEDPALTVLSHADIFPASRRLRSTWRAPSAARLAAVSEFTEGDYVVHRTHGIARYAGMVRKEIAGVERDYLLLEYAAGDKLYVPVDQLDRVSRYIGADATPPRLTRLSTQDWSRAKARARASVKTLAFDLAKLYAQRSAARGWAFSEDTEWARELAAGFPFEETPDQLTAIEAVTADMEQARPMDRIVCGDVGYGKTEVAIRAAFKAVQDGKQVIVLAPTTILAQQHYQVFAERYAPFPVRVDVLSRFKTEAAQRRILVDLQRGAVDVLIGTHRLLSEDVRPKDLGLVVIDEEQRFGVGHKEHFTHLRRTVDVLTLSATPIPRTLQMALSGVRDLALIETPPLDRMPVATHVGRFDPSMAANAIRRELAREGQIYYVHNRVEDIDSAAARVAKSVPEARVAVAHGQMHEHALEQVMLHFLEGEIDILVCTTIIENGLDIPTANTLVVEQAERLGLAQLYQLRGRVGRSSHKAYAYLFYGDIDRMTPAAGERLKTIHDFTALGSGFRIAMKDLEIRGAGNLLGPEQSGQMAAVGFDLYVQMLKEAVGELTGEAVPEPIDVRMDLPLDAFIPADYIPDEESRIEAYHDLAGAQDASELAIIESRLIDRYGGPLPAPVSGLIQVLDLKQMAAAAGLSEVVVRRDTATLLPIDLTPTQLSVLGREGLKVRYVENAQKLVVTLGEVAVGMELGPDQVTGGLGEALRAILTTVVQA